MGEIKTEGSTLQEGAIFNIEAAAKKLGALEKSIADANTELELLNEDLSRKKVERAEIDQAIVDAKADLSLLNDEYETKATEIALSTKDASELNSEITVKFTMPAFRHDGVEYKSKEVEAAAAEEETWAMDIIDHLLKIKSGIVEIVKKGGQ